MTVQIRECNNCVGLFDDRCGIKCPHCGWERGGLIGSERLLALAESVDRAARIEELWKLLSCGAFSTLMAGDCRELIEARLAEALEVGS